MKNSDDADASLYDAPQIVVFHDPPVMDTMEIRYNLDPSYEAFLTSDAVGYAPNPQRTSYLVPPQSGLGYLSSEVSEVSSDTSFDSVNNNIGTSPHQNEGARGRSPFITRPSHGLSTHSMPPGGLQTMLPSTDRPTLIRVRYGNSSGATGASALFDRDALPVEPDFSTLIRGHGALDRTLMISDTISEPTPLTPSHGASSRGRNASSLLRHPQLTVSSNDAARYAHNLQWTPFLVPDPSEVWCPSSDVSSFDSFNNNLGTSSHQNEGARGRLPFITRPSHGLSTRSMPPTSNHVRHGNSSDAAARLYRDAWPGQAMEPSLFSSVQGYGVLDCTPSVNEIISDPTPPIPRDVSGRGRSPHRRSRVSWSRTPSPYSRLDASPMRGPSPTQLSGDHSKSIPVWQELSHQANVNRLNDWNQVSAHMTPDYIHLRENPITTDYWALDALNELHIMKSTSDAPTTEATANLRFPAIVGQPFRPVGTHAGAEASRRRRSNTASDQVTFKCTVEGCGSDFTTRHNLKNHLYSHFGIRPFVCPVCGDDFTTKHTMNRHRHNIHKDG